MPELAFGYLIGFTATLSLVALHIFLQGRKQKSSAMRNIQSNLKKINLFWADSEADIKSYSPGAEKADLEKSIRSICIAGTAFTFMSWAGFFLQLTVMASIRFLAIKRLESKLFDSELAKVDLTPEVAQSEVNRLQN